MTSTIQDGALLSPLGYHSPGATTIGRLRILDVLSHLLCEWRLSHPMSSKSVCGSSNSQTRTYIRSKDAYKRHTLCLSPVLRCIHAWKRGCYLLFLLCRGGNQESRNAQFVIWICDLVVRVDRLGEPCIERHLSCILFPFSPRFRLRRLFLGLSQGPLQSKLGLLMCVNKALDNIIEFSCLYVEFLGALSRVCISFFLFCSPERDIPHTMA